MSKSSYCLAAALLVLIPIPAHPAEMTVQIREAPYSCKGFMIDLSGEIVSGDALKLEKGLEIYARKKCNGDRQLPGVVRFFSNGGNVLESMAIGRVIRNYYLDTIVPWKTECLSSCVFAFVGGVNKSAIGKFGIHRPYYTVLDRNHSLQQIRSEREKMHAEIRSYLQDMDISTSLLDDMLSIAPEKMKILGPDEVTRYRIDVKDANIEEAETAQRAYAYGMTSAEYRAKYDPIFDACYDAYGDGARLMPCVISKMLGISPIDAQKRAKALAKCSLADRKAYLECELRALATNR